MTHWCENHRREGGIIGNIRRIRKPRIICLYLALWSVIIIWIKGTLIIGIENSDEKERGKMKSGLQQYLTKSCFFLFIILLLRITLMTFVRFLQY